MIYRVSRILCGLILRSLARVTVSGPAPPEEGGCLIVCNHISHLDPPLVGVAFRRPVDFMAMEELFRARWFAVWLRAVNAISTDRRGRDPRAMRTAVRRLKAGRVVCLFPEGGLRSGEESVLGGKAMSPGAGVLSNLGGVPVVPCLILGTDQFYDWRAVFRRPTLRLEWGEPIAPRRDREAMNGAIESALRLMYDDWKRGCDFDPVLVPQTAEERMGNHK